MVLHHTPHRSTFNAHSFVNRPGPVRVPRSDGWSEVGHRPGPRRRPWSRATPSGDRNGLLSDRNGPLGYRIGNSRLPEADLVSQTRPASVISLIRTWHRAHADTRRTVMNAWS